MSILIKIILTILFATILLYGIITCILPYKYRKNKYYNKFNNYLMFIIIIDLTISLIFYFTCLFYKIWIN